MALIPSLGVFVLSILTAALSRLLLAEITAWSPAIIRTLIKFAVWCLPAHQRERFSEEWQSHVNDIPGHVGKLLAAMGFVFAAWNLALSDRRSQSLKGLLRALAEMDDVQSTSAAVINAIQRDQTLASHEDLCQWVNNLKESSSKLRELRDQLAIDIANASAARRISLVSWPYDRARRAMCDRSTGLTRQIRETGAQIVEHVGKRTKRPGS